MICRCGALAVHRDEAFRPRGFWRSVLGLAQRVEVRWSCEDHWSPAGLIRATRRRKTVDELIAEALDGGRP